MRGILRTLVLFLVFMLLLSIVGWFLAGFFGTSPWVSLLAFAIVAGGLNFAMYFYSAKIVLASYRVRMVTPQEAPRLHRLVDKVALQAGIPKPQVGIIPSRSLNAFATGRNPKHAVVAATEGILEALNDEELEGVLAHEVSHVKNRDVLIMTIAAMMAAILSFAARILIFGDRRDVNPLLFIIVLITAPLAAILVQLAISRSREYAADATGARVSGKPWALASALRKLEAGTHSRPMHRGNPATSSLFIVNPFRGRGFVNLFSTHPPTEERIKRLERMV